jgi:hypothetical protein
VPAATIKKLNMAACAFMQAFRTCFIITKYTGYDPEVDTFNAGYGSNAAFSQNLDFFAPPRPRVWNLGVQVGF